MVDKARQYKPSHLRRLFTLSKNECAEPDCSKSLTARDGITSISNICHIEAASDKGPRYRENMSDDERRHYDNLILLCDECHKIIDNKENEENYPVALLKDWKRQHEEKGRMSLIKKSSYLKHAIDAISSADFTETSEGIETKISVFDIGKKIEHNSIVRNKTLIEDYKIFYTKLSSLYAELESQGSFKKENLLRNIGRIYSSVKGKYVGTSENKTAIIQANADNIIEDIEERLAESCREYSDLYDEDIAFGISIVMVDAFMRCKILEEPPIS